MIKLGLPVSRSQPEDAGIIICVKLIANLEICRLAFVKLYSLLSSLVFDGAYGCRVVVRKLFLVGKTLYKSIKVVVRKLFLVDKT